MKNLFLAIGLLVVLVIGASCSENVLSVFADKDTDAAKYLQAQILIDAENYDEAISVLMTTTSEFQQKNDFKTLLASAYGGRAGLNFLDVIQNFQDASSVKLFPFLMQGFAAGTVAKVTDLNSAMATINSISADPSLREEDANILMVLLSFAKMGYILSGFGDVDSDGNLDATFTDACLDADNPGTSIGDSMVGELGIGLMTALNTLSHVSNNFTENVLGGSSGIDDCVNDIEGLNPAFTGICSVTDPTAYTTLQIKGFRSLMKEDSIMGLGVSCTGDVTACNCP